MNEPQKLLTADEQKHFPTIAEMREKASELLTVHPHGTLILYGEFIAAIGVDPRVNTRARTAILRAGRDMLHRDQKKLLNVRTIGYRIVLPHEQKSVSQAEQRRARRQYKKSLETVTYVAMDKLDPIQVAELLQEQARSAIMVAMGQRVRNLKALLPKEELELPSGPKLVDMMRRKSAR